MTDWRKIAAGLESSIRLRTPPLGWKVFDKVEDLENVSRLRRLPTKVTMCQLLTLSRTLGWTLGATQKDLFLWCSFVYGFRSDLPETFKKAYSNQWFKTREDYEKKLASTPVIPAGKEALVIAPLASGSIDPDVVIFYANPAQMAVVINGLQFEDYEKIEMSNVGETACADSIVNCYNTKKPSITIPCFGERRFGAVNEDELIAALTPETTEKLLKGLAGLRAVGIFYPIPPFGPQADNLPGFPASYQAAAREDLAFRYPRKYEQLSEVPREEKNQGKKKKK
jgi:uncharacterized protein (DUF169 family)